MFWMEKNAVPNPGSEEMNDSDRIAQVAQDKWATLRDSLRSLRGNEQMSDWLKKNLYTIKIFFVF